MPVSKVNNNTKTVIESKVLPSQVEDINNSADNDNINEIAITKSFQKGVNVWPILVIVIISERSTKIVAFIIVLIISIGLVFISVIDIT